MITIFNRKEFAITYDMQKQAEICRLLQSHGIEYKVNVLNRKSPSPLSVGARAYTGTLGEDLDKAYEYKIYVKKEAYVKARKLINV